MTQEREVVPITIRTFKDGKSGVIPLPLMRSLTEKIIAGAVEKGAVTERADFEDSDLVYSRGAKVAKPAQALVHLDPAEQRLLVPLADAKFFAVQWYGTTLCAIGQDGNVLQQCYYDKGIEASCLKPYVTVKRIQVPSEDTKEENIRALLDPIVARAPIKILGTYYSSSKMCGSKPEGLETIYDGQHVGLNTYLGPLVDKTGVQCNLNDMIPGAADEPAYHLSVSEDGDGSVDMPTGKRLFNDPRSNICTAEIVVGEDTFRKLLLPLVERRQWFVQLLAASVAPAIADNGVVRIRNIHGIEHTIFYSPAQKPSAWDVLLRR